MIDNESVATHVTLTLPLTQPSMENANMFLKVNKSAIRWTRILFLGRITKWAQMGRQLRESVEYEAT